MLPGDELTARLPRFCRLAAPPLPVVELFPIGLLTAPQHGHRAPGLLYHLHDAVQCLQGGMSFQSCSRGHLPNFLSEGPSQENET